jgi:hypothetical protein
MDGTRRRKTKSQLPIRAQLSGQSFEQIVVNRLEEQNCRGHPLQSRSADTPEHQIIEGSWWVAFHFVPEGHLLSAGLEKSTPATSSRYES